MINKKYKSRKQFIASGNQTHQRSLEITISIIDDLQMWKPVVVIFSTCFQENEYVKKETYDVSAPRSCMIISNQYGTTATKCPVIQSTGFYYDIV
jgi:hypothetical protein